MMSDRSSAWLVGLVSHLLNSVLLVLVWAMVVQPNLSIHRVFAGSCGVSSRRRLAGAS